jgi:UDP-glucose 4-epimerase
MDSQARRIALITGFAGWTARTVGAELSSQGYQIVGVDYRPPGPPPPYEAQTYQANYNKTRIEDIFRRHRPTHVLHLGRVGNLKVQMGKRFDLNVMGSAKVKELSLKYNSRRLVVLSTFHIYGAHPHNHTPIYEHDPLRAGTAFPQIADAIQLDNQALMWIYQHPELQTVLLRPTNVIGPGVMNAMSRFLRQDWLPVMLGFDPMVQFLYESDLVRAIVAANEAQPVGVFNLAGVSTVPWRGALEMAGGRILPMPSSFAALYLRLAGTLGPALPPYLVNFTKYPCIISDEAFRETFGWRPEVDVDRAIRETVSDGHPQR